MKMKRTTYDLMHFPLRVLVNYRLDNNSAVDNWKNLSRGGELVKAFITIKGVFCIGERRDGGKNGINL